MKKSTVNTICFTICILSIISAALLAILGIWNFIPSKDLFFRSFITLAVMFCSGLLTMVVNNLYLKSNTDKPA